MLAAVLVIAMLGCVPSAACDLVIVPAGGPELDHVPADVEPIVSAADLDPLGWRIVPDDGSGLGDQVAFRLRPEGAERLAAFTRANIGGWIGIAIDGAVVAVPMVQAPIEDGDVAISGASDDEGFVERFRSCLPTELLPTG